MKPQRYIAFYTLSKHTVHSFNNQKGLYKLTKICLDMQYRFAVKVVAGIHGLNSLEVANRFIPVPICF